MFIPWPYTDVMKATASQSTVQFDRKVGRSARFMNEVDRPVPLYDEPDLNKLSMCYCIMINNPCFCT